MMEGDDLNPDGYVLEGGRTFVLCCLVFMLAVWITAVTVRALDVPVIRQARQEAAHATARLHELEVRRGPCPKTSARP